MTIDEAIAKLDALSGDDPRAAHSDADSIVLDYLVANGAVGIADAYDRVVKRCRWWACA